jgi:hypothetical protein
MTNKSGLNINLSGFKASTLSYHSALITYSEFKNTVGCNEQSNLPIVY